MHRLQKANLIVLYFKDIMLYDNTVRLSLFAITLHTHYFYFSEYPQTYIYIYIYIYIGIHELGRCTCVFLHLHIRLSKVKLDHIYCIYGCFLFPTRGKFSLFPIASLLLFNLNLYPLIFRSFYALLTQTFPFTSCNWTVWQLTK